MSYAVRDARLDLTPARPCAACKASSSGIPDVCRAVPRQPLRRSPRLPSIKQVCAVRTTSTIKCVIGNGGGHNGRPGLSDEDLRQLHNAARLADSSAGLTQPHPNAGCVLVSRDGRTVAETFQRAQGSASAEVLAAAAAGPAAAGGTAYLNLETGDCHGDDASVAALLGAGVRRAVLGLRHPLPHLRGSAVVALRRAGVAVEVLGEAPCLAGDEAEAAALQACWAVNEALMHRAATGRPLSVLKYAMTADGKIATAAGHSAWVSSPESRQLVFDARARSDAIIVGGNTVRRDNPKLTTRREGHTPARIVMSRTLDLPEDANLWNVDSGPTIVMTQRGARSGFQARVRARGVEVVQFDFLTPEAVAAYCAERGFLAVLWECGGLLAAPAIAAGVVHKAMAFIAPKLIGGARAPTPVGDLGNVEMTQALPLAEPAWRLVGPDVLLTGYLPSSGGLAALHAALAAGATRPHVLDAVRATSSGAGAKAAPGTGGPGPQAAGPQRRRRVPDEVVEFYKPWDRYGALSNFSPHPVQLPGGPSPPAGGNGAAAPPAPLLTWRSVEHYYQTQKFGGLAGEAMAPEVAAVAAAESPEEAARLGRALERTRPHLLRADWPDAKLGVMLVALRAKFAAHAGPRAMLLASGAPGPRGEVRELVEASPHDFFWGCGVDGTGSNHLGRLLAQVRAELEEVQGAGGQEPDAGARWHEPAAGATQDAGAAARNYILTL